MAEISWRNAELLQSDWLKTQDDLISEDDLTSAIIISLFTDRVARDDDNVEGDNRRGWWGDTHSDYLIGSRLWLLNREKLTAEVARKAESYAHEALRWMVDDGVVSLIEVVTQIVWPGRLNMIIRYHQPGNEGDLRFFWVWEKTDAV